MYLIKVKPGCGDHVENEGQTFKAGENFFSAIPWHKRMRGKFVLVKIVADDNPRAKRQVEAAALAKANPEPIVPAPEDADELDELETDEEPEDLGADVTAQVKQAGKAGVKVYKSGRKTYRVVDIETGDEIEDEAGPIEGKAELNAFIKAIIADMG